MCVPIDWIEPILRARAERERIRVHGAAEPDKREIEADLGAFRARLAALAQADAAAAE